VAVQAYAYWAFISYKHCDEIAARRLHAALETYRLPKRLVGLPGHFGATPPRLFPIFRDRDELAGSSNLSASIKTALDQSRSLIVICSRETLASHWVNEEIAYFRSLGRGDRIFAYLIDGEPADSFPAELTRDGVEPLAADARAQGDGMRGALLKLVAGIAGVPFDALRARDAQRRAARARASVAAAIAAIVCVAVTYIGLADAGAPIARGDAIRRDLDRYGFSVFRPVPSDAALRAQAASLREQYVQLVGRQGKSDAWFWGPGTHRDTWTAGQAASGALRPPWMPRDVQRAFVADIDASFVPGLLNAYGFQTSTHSFRISEPALWLATAMEEALGSRDLLTRTERARYRRELATVQHSTTHYGPAADGHWSTFPDQRDRNGYSTYAATVALLALLAARDAGTGWNGSYTSRDAYLRETAAWLTHECVVDRNDGFRPHCQPQPYAQEENYPGLTLQVYAELMRAERYGYLRVPKAQDNDVAAQLDHAVSEAQNGQLSGTTETKSQGSQNISFVVTPWAIECAAEYLMRLRTLHARRDVIAQYQRIIGDLLATSSKSLTDPSPDLFPRTETPFALADVERL